MFNCGCINNKTILTVDHICSIGIHNFRLWCGRNGKRTVWFKKVLIAVFSYTGNTRQVAQAIQQKTGGTLIGIEPENLYSKDYQTVVKQGKKEVDSKFQPKLKTELANIRDYDAISVDSTIWWYTIVPTVAAFLHNHDLSDKVVAPSFTHDGYGIGHSLDNIRNHAPKSKLFQEFELDRNFLKEINVKVTEWLKEIGVEKMIQNKQTTRIKTADSIRDIVNHPAFRDFGRHILP